MIISIHIPKCAGVSFQNALKEIYNKDYQGDYKDKLDSKEYQKNQIPTKISIKKGVKVIHGHFQAIKYIDKYPNATYITWLRDPIERIASHYYFWKRVPDKKNSTCMEMVNNDYTLLEFARMSEIKNLQSFCISPLNFSNFGFLGITEYYYQNTVLLKKALKLKKDIPLMADNINPKTKGSKYDIDEKTRSEIKRIHRKDVLLYNIAKSIFYTKYAPIKIQKILNEAKEKYT